MAPLPAEVLELIAKFDAQSDLYLSPTYNEAQLRIDFVNPMFKALGWDMDNTKGYSEAFREVVHEDAIRIQGTVKSPDYSFRLGGHRLFFLEAKKPSVSLRDDVTPAYQLRRYAWSTGLPLSILSNFKELAVYDCRIKPKHLEPAATARLLYFTYKEYPQRWDEIASIFSPQGIQHGGFDRYAESNKKSGTQQFDEVFLDEMEEWRKKLAENLARRNPGLDQSGLNFATQRIIDRIIFLRMCEDRGIEPAFQLQALLSGDKTYPRLLELFTKADQRYNSGLFHFRPEKDRHEQPDELTPGLELDDAALKHVVKRLYYPDSPYVFKEVAGDILGSVYERFLGNVIHLTAGHHARVEAKPEVRKAGGVYYTPKYIVDYIVQNTVGKLLSPSPLGGEGRGEGKSLTPLQASKLRILDPACGSGSFLLGAYQHLLDWHQQWYLANDPAKWSKGKNATLRPGPNGELVLAIRERKRILTANIYGVDLDPQAVEVTKLSLLLKCLEGESAQSINDLLLFHERALPDLGDNIKCGNSLIGTDVFSTSTWEQMSDVDRHRVNPFDFDSAFPEAFKQGGFDAVIGNPPWGQKEVGKDGLLEARIRERFPSVVGIFDLYRPFVELAVRLTRQGGLLGQVLPDIVLLKDYETTRRLLLEQTTLLRIDWWGMAFRDAVIDAATIVAGRAAAEPDHRVNVAIRVNGTIERHALPQAGFARNPRATFNLFLTDERRALVERLANHPRLGDYFEVHEGVHSGNMREALFVNRRADKTCRELIFGRDEIAAYHLQWHGRYIRLGAMPATKTRARYANIGQASWHEREKVLVRRTGDFVLAAVDDVGRYCSNNFFVLFPDAPHPLDLYGVCALLNSRVITTYFRLIEPRKGRVFAELKIKHLATFPLPDPARRREIAELNKLGLARAEVAKKLSGASVPDDRERLLREAKHMDGKIDALAGRLLGVAASELEKLEI